jgi:hypothetical protein
MTGYRPVTGGCCTSGSKRVTTITKINWRDVNGTGLSACAAQWAAAEIGGSRADAFLGAQGDVWDTQWDMLMALIGAIAAQLLLARRHDRELASLS